MKKTTKVMKGESLGDVAARVGLSRAALVAANPHKPAMLGAVPYFLELGIGETLFLGDVLVDVSISKATPLETLALAAVLTNANKATFDSSIGELKGQGFHYLLKSRSPSVTEADYKVSMGALTGNKTSGAPLMKIDLNGHTLSSDATDLAIKASVALMQTDAQAPNFSVMKRIAYRAMSLLLFEQVAAVAIDRQMSFQETYSAIKANGFSSTDDYWMTAVDPITSISIDDDTGLKASTGDVYLAYETGVSLIKLAESALNASLDSESYAVPMYSVQVGSTTEADMIAAGMLVGDKLYGKDVTVSFSVNGAQSDANYKVYIETKSGMSGVSAEVDSFDIVAGNIVDLLSGMTAAVAKYYASLPKVPVTVVPPPVFTPPVKQTTVTPGGGGGADNVDVQGKPPPQKTAAEIAAEAKAAADKLAAETKAAADKAAADAKAAAEKAAADAKAAAEKAAADLLSSKSSSTEPERPKSNTFAWVATTAILLTAVGLFVATLNQNHPKEKVSP